MTGAHGVSCILDIFSSCGRIGILDLLSPTRGSIGPEPLGKPSITEEVNRSFINTYKVVK